jgi:adenylate kinase
VLKIILLGPPGSGKGTQAELLSKQFSMQHLSTGELLRQAILNNTNLGIQAKAAIEAGQLVSDDIIINLVKDEIVKLKNNTKGLILDGFPRNLFQAQMLDAEGILIDWIIYLKVSDQIIIHRLAGRRYHANSGRVYHVEYNPPQFEGLDDLTREPLIIRKDDQEDIIRQRLSIYHQNTEKIINWYKTRNFNKFVEIDGTATFNQIFQKLIELIEPN